jgi:predicted oxidoreductase
MAAYEAGYTLFDHADIYCRGMCETVFGQAMKDVPGMRDHILIATKCGIRFPGEPKPDSPHRYDFSAEHILWSCDQSLKRLGTDYIDIYQLHRPDVLMDPQEVAGAFEELKKAGKVRHFGVSNFTPSQVTALQSAWPDIVVNQVRVSLGELGCLYDGTLDQCLERRITPLAWSPMGGGFLGTGGTPDAKDEKRVKLVELMDQIAVKYGTTRTVIALAWLLKHPSKIIPIVGSSNPERIRESVKADEVELDREDWYRLLVAARGQGLA